MMKRFLAQLAIIAAATAGLLAHARVFDFVCDDAFITLRFSRNLAMYGAPVYNVGDRVEGFTSPLWMVLCALGMKLGLTAESSLRAVSVVSAFALMSATWMLWRRVEPTRWAGGMFALAGVAVSAPVAAWTLGGLETPLFAALVTASIALGATASIRGTWRAGALAGVALALATLTRPEGAALTAIVTFIALLFARKHRGGIKAIAGIVLAYLAIMGPCEAFRIVYYGYPLPNTFYVKTSGSGLFAEGIRYIRLCLNEMGEPLTQILIGGLFIPARVLAFDEGRRSDARRAALWMSRVFVLALIPYVASVGGDFLDLYRFLVPMFPLVAVGCAHGATRLVRRWAPGRGRVIAVACVLGITIGPHAWRQFVVGKRARQLADKRRESASVEPIGWTRQYAQRWSATGRWIHAHAKPGDWMVTGAAGAMPFYAGPEVKNLDVLGLCDAWVSHNGKIIGSRPGHQREATEEYMLSKRPAFIFFSDHIETAFNLPKRDKGWEGKGYVWSVAKVTTEKYGAPKTFYHYFLLRIDRAQELMSDEDIQTALGLPE
jgi:hypothetical protein